MYKIASLSFVTFSFFIIKNVFVLQCFTFIIIHLNFIVSFWETGDELGMQNIDKRIANYFEKIKKMKLEFFEMEKLFFFLFVKDEWLRGGFSLFSELLVWLLVLSGVVLSVFFCQLIHQFSKKHLKFFNKSNKFNPQKIHSTLKFLHQIRLTSSFLHLSPIHLLPIENPNRLSEKYRQQHKKKVWQ